MSPHEEFPPLTPEAAAAVDAGYGAAGVVMASDRNRVLFAAFLREALRLALSVSTPGSCWLELKAIADNLHSPPPPPPTLAQAREADLNTPAGRDVVRDFLATLGGGEQP
jgi:hypothetical protein